MAKAATFITSALCVLALAGFAHCHKEVFNVEGKVYCDTCRVLFQTSVSTYVADAEVELACRDQENETVTYTVTAKTDKDGHYNMEVTGDHENEICDITVKKSPDPECDQIADEINSARVTLTDNSGIKSTRRYANPIGFVKKVAIPKCTEVLEEMGFIPIDH